MKRSVTCKEPSLKCQPNTRVRSQFYSEDSSLRHDWKNFRRWFESPEFSHYDRNSHCMMENMGYDLTKRSGLNVDKEIRTLLRSFVLKGKAPDTTTRFEEDWAMCPPSIIRFWIWRIIISRSLVGHVIVGVRCQCWCYLWKSFNKYGFNELSGR